MPSLVGLLRIESRPAGILGFNVTDFADDRSTGVNDGGFAFRVGATIARERKQPFDGLVGWGCHQCQIVFLLIGIGKT